MSATQKTTAVPVTDPLPETSWPLAAPVAERIAAGPVLRSDVGRGVRRFAGWTDLAAFRVPVIKLDRRLAPLGVTAEQLIALLGEPSAALRDRLSAPAPWVERFRAAWAAAPATDDGLPADLGLLELLRPLLRDARRRLATRLATARYPDDLASLPALLADGLPLAELRLVAAPTLILEMNVARIQGRLSGETAAERLAGYTRLLRDPAVAAAVWAEYPVLARLATTVLDNWVDSRVEFAQRLVDGLPALRAALWPDGAPGALTAVAFGAGDRHQGGRSVAVVTFARDRVVYKPRPMAADVAFDRYLAWFNDTGPEHPLRRLRVLDRGDHGWAEYAAAATCASPAQRAALAWRTGALLALLHSLAARDVHPSDLIAAGADPVLLDLEALFQQAVPVAPAARTGPAARVLASSVLAVGLLPVAGTDTDTDTDADEREHREGPPTVRVWADPDLDTGADALRAASRRAGRPGDGTRAVPDGAFRDEVIAGYTHAYRTVCAGRSALLGAGGILDGFADAPLRLALRSPGRYEIELVDSLQPDFLRDALDRDRCLARLYSGLRAVAHRDELIGAEIEALSGADIPVFAMTASSRDVLIPDGRRVPDVLSRTPLDVARARVAVMGPRDLAVQTRVIRDAYGVAAPAAATTGPAGRARHTGRPAVESAGRGRAGLRHAEPGGAGRRRAAAGRGRGDRRAARRTGRPGRRGDRLVRPYPGRRRTDRTRPGRGSTCTRDSAGSACSTRTWPARPAGPPGGGWPGRSPARSRWTRGWRRSITPGRSTGYAVRVYAGVFGPAGGAVYYLSHVAGLLEDDALLEPAQALLPVLARAVGYDRGYDVAGGSAGAVLALLSLHAAAPRDTSALRLASRPRSACSTGAPRSPEGTGGSPPPSSPGRPWPAWPSARPASLWR